MFEPSSLSKIFKILLQTSNKSKNLFKKKRELLNTKGTYFSCTFAFFILKVLLKVESKFECTNDQFSTLYKRYNREFEEKFRIKFCSLRFYHSTSFTNIILIFNVSNFIC